ncbi:hypothetical protein PR003_g6791 [Phytophthora rubi]|uniref:RxLR effector protein n=2 Tax=Phytophthora rubi TaxID=129364 RepID=A0A6A3NBG9_9STRA|nr:hypothetical protein PR001_g7756 [Phytophthora rubi]KAE9347702.1 hypothetical protein PR003_g6791 [Phytophthora rubi]
MRLGYILLVVVAFAIQGFAVADNAFGQENAVPKYSSSLRSSSKAEAGVDMTNAETEERMKLPGIAKLNIFSKKESSAIKNLKENSALTTRLNSNPSLRKSLENNPQLVKPFENLQKDAAVMERLKTLEKSPSMNKLKTVINKNPSSLTEDSVKKLGAIVKKPSRFKMGEGTGQGLLILGLILLVLLGATITLAATGELKR